MLIVHSIDLLAHNSCCSIPVQKHGEDSAQITCIREESPAVECDNELVTVRATSVISSRYIKNVKVFHMLLITVYKKNTYYTDLNFKKIVSVC